MRPTDWVNTRPRLGELLGGDSGTGEGQEPGPSCCDPDPTLPDRGSGDDGAIATALSSGTLAYVQGKATNNANTDATIAITFDDPATGGNLLIAFYSARTGSTSSGAVTPSGWTRYANDFSGPSFDGGASTIFYKIAAGGETTITIVKGGSDYASLEVSEYSGNLSFDTADDADSVAASTSLATDAITPAGTNVLLYAAFNQSARTATYTWGSSFTELSDVNVYTSGPSSTSGYRIVTGASGSYSATATSSESDGYGWAILAFTASGSAWSVRADPVNDGNDATYQTVTGTDLIRLDLGAAHRIVSTRIRIAANTSGARTFTIKAANAVDFSDEVTLATIPFTATGSLTAQDVVATWVNTTAYRYFELDIGTSDTYRIHAWELYEGTLATDISGHVDATDDAHDASAIAYDNGSSGLASDNLQDAIDELAGGPVITALDDIPDVNAPSPSDADVLTWDNGAGEWVAAAPTGAADITDLPTAETDTSLVLHPDGAGGVEWGADDTGGGGGFEQIGMTNVASNAANTTNIGVTISAPTPGNTLVVLVKSDGRDQTGISCTNVTFTSRYNNNGNSQYVRVYTGVVGTSPGTTVTITHGSSNWVEAVVMEFPVAFANAGNSVFASAGSGTITQAIGMWATLYSTVVGRYVFVITGESNGTTPMRAAMTSTHVCLNTAGTGSFAYGPSPGGAVSVGTYTATSGTLNRCIAAVELYA